MKSMNFDTTRLIEMCRANDAVMVGIFGSVARGEATDESDIDVLLKFSKRKSLLDLVRMEREISTAMGKKIELLTEGAISPYLRDGIMRDLKVIYEA